MDRGSFANRFAQRDAEVADFFQEPDASASVSLGTSGGPFLLAADHQGAADSPLRGFVYWRSTDTRRQISRMTDREIHRRIDFLYHHYGFCRRLIHGLAKHCGILTPQPDTPDEAWNEEAWDSFLFVARSPEIYDQGGRFDFFTGQYQTNVSRFKSGRSLAVLTETESKRASHAFYESHQIDHESSRAGDDRIVQGVDLSKFSRHLGYYLRDADNPDGKPVRYDAQDCLYFGKFDNHGQAHPMSVFAFAVANMVDVVETTGMWKAAIKSTATRGEVIEQDAATKFVQGPSGIGTLVPVESTTSDGKKIVVQRRMVFGGGAEVVPLAPGQKMRVITDDRPTAQNLEFRRELMEDCVLGSDLPAAALMHVAGLTGPNVRFVMEDIERWILLQHLWQARKCHAIYTRVLAKEIKAGRLREPVGKDGKKVAWWRPQYVYWYGLPSMTIDRGRDARMSVIRLDTGLTTWGDEHAKEGVFWKKALTARVQEVAWLKKKIWEADKALKAETGDEVGLVYEEVIKRPNTTLLIGPESDPAVDPAPDK